jgi:hypothetical protein
MKKQIQLMSLILAILSSPILVSQVLHQPFSFSIYSYLGTNHIFSSKTTNDVSLNLFYGHSKGVDIMEIGACLNQVDGNVKYLQIAGLGNIVKDSVSGLQAAGLFNTSRNINGIQLAGLFNLNSKSSKGISAAGLFTIANSTKGIQASGLFNKTDSVQGIQAAGLFNIANNTKGIQASGLFNKADTVEGIQATGILNVTKHLKGLQLGLFNIADSISDNSLPIGLLSIVRKGGYAKLELSGNELGFINFGGRIGVRKFHNIFFGGASFFSTKRLWTLGYGIGSTLPVKGPFSITAEAISQSLFFSYSRNLDLSQIYKLQVALEYTSNAGYSFAIGPTFNMLNNNLYNTKYAALIDKAIPLGVYEKSSTNHQYRQKYWFGVQASVKLF